MPTTSVTVEPLLLLSRKRAEAGFQAAQQRIFSLAEINQFIADHSDGWLHEEPPRPRIAAAIDKGTEIPLKSPSVAAILKSLLANTQLQRIRLPFPYRTDTRYTWGDIPTHQLIQSLDAQGYFSHYTAMHFHGLTDQIPKTIYFNVEQHATAGGGQLTQHGIDRAFKGKCRVTSNYVTFREVRIYKLNGANTGRLGVVPFKTDEGEDIRVTDIERTLIDAVVRPVYAGGIGEVAEAFRAAADRLSVRRLVSYLRKLDYTYPYHQTIGYYLERAGAYKQSQINLLRQFPIEFDFNLNYQIKNPAYNERWRLFVPQGF